jgi:phage tail sheath protein FI
MKGALAGIDEKDAFRVLIGLDESMTQEDVVAGRLIMTVELAVLAPAEFIQINLQFRTVEISAPRSGASRSEGVFS